MAIPTTKVILIDQEISTGSQSVELVAILNFTNLKLRAKAEAKLRVSIKSDSYKSQSYARVERWNGERWHEIASIHYGKMATREGLCYLPRGTGKDFRHFEADYNRLLGLATAVLS